MTERMVSVPVEPTPDMNIAGGIAICEARETALTAVDEADACYRAMLTAAPVREEGGAVSEVLFRALRSYKLTNMGCEDDPHIGYPLVDLMSNDGAEITTGEEEMRVLADYLASALRAQPPAREDAQPVGWRDRFVVSRDGREWSDWNYHDEFPPARPVEQQVEALYTHPAPDALRVAVEALVNEFAWSAVTADCEEARVELQSRIDAVRTALQAEQKGGA